LRRPRILAIAAVLVLMVVAGVVAFGGGDGGGKAVEVGALWYGTTQDGNTVGGVTPVDITAGTDDPQTPLSVDLRGLQASGAGPMWRAATAVGATQAVLISGTDPRLQQLDYSLHEAIDGPSAGALLSVGSLAALRGSQISGSTTMTGTVLPDGSVGPVSGIAEKVRAAAAAGYTRVLIPRGLKVVSDPRTGKEVDPVKLGRSLGVKVTPVASVPSAYAAMTAQSGRSFTRPPPPIRPGLLRMLTRHSQALIATAGRHVTELAGGAGSAAKTVASIRALVGAAKRALARKDPVLAYAASAEAAQAGQQSVAAARLQAAAKHATLGELTAKVSRSAEHSLGSIRAQVHATAETPVTRRAQLPALSDTLAWGAFALTSLEVAQDRLKTVRTEPQLEQIVRFIETARFEAATYMPTCARSLAYIGRHPISTRTVGVLNAYSKLIASAADANQKYADTIGLGTSDNSYLGQLLNRSNDLNRGVSPAFRNLHGPTAGPASRMSVALLQYVESTQLVNDLTYRDGSGINGPPNLAPIKDPHTVRTQARSADAIARKQVREIAAAGMDPSFVQWNSQWGADLALKRLPNTTEEQTLHGLQFQWFAVLQSRLLIALERS
jgi:Lon protease (S16) C-terminal proteolytic domain